MDGVTEPLIESEVNAKAAMKEAKKQRQHDDVVRSVAQADLPTIMKRVAFVLNHYPHTRDSDVALMLRYWEEFEDYTGGVITREHLFEFERLTTITRARAAIQNTLALYQARDDVRRRRKEISEDVREASPSRPDVPTTIVYTDESGKNETHLIVGSVWFSRPASVLALVARNA